jgi:hypothetical protein
MLSGAVVRVRCVTGRGIPIFWPAKGDIAPWAPTPTDHVTLSISDTYLECGACSEGYPASSQVSRDGNVITVTVSYWNRDAAQLRWLHLSGGPRCAADRSIYCQLPACPQPAGALVTFDWLFRVSDRLRHRCRILRAVTRALFRHQRQRGDCGARQRHDPRLDANRRKLPCHPRNGPTHDRSFGLPLLWLTSGRVELAFLHILPKRMRRGPTALAQRVVVGNSGRVRGAACASR